MDFSGLPDDTLNPSLDLSGLPDSNAKALREQYRATKATPDDTAKVLDLSNRTGLPAPVVQRNRQEAERQAFEPDWGDLETRAPLTVRELAANTKLFDLAHDDTDNLSGIERTMNRRSQGVIGGPAFVRPEGDIKASRGPEASFSSIAYGLANSFTQGAARAREGVRMQFADAFGLDAMFQDALRKRDQSQSRQDLTTPTFESSTARGLYAGGASTLQNLPGLAASILTRSPTPALASAGVQTELDAYGKYRSRGASGGEALLGAAGEGGIEVATEMIPLRTMLGAFGQPGKTFAKEFVKSQVQEQFGEQAATILQDAIDTAVANPNKTWGDYLKERPDAAYQTALATLVQSGVMTGGHVALSKLAGEDAKAQGAARDAEAIQQISQLAAASKLRARDPQTFQDFVAAANEDGPVQDIYIDARTLQQAGIDLAVLAQASPSVAQQAEEALATGGDLVIPMAEYASRIAGTELDPVLTPHLRTSEDGLSLDEAQRFYQTQAEQFKEAAAKAMQDKATDDAWQQSAKVVEAQLFDQLKSTGRFTDDVNTAYSTLLGKVFETTAYRLGLTPQEVLSRFPIQAAAERAASDARMEQGMNDRRLALREKHKEAGVTFTSSNIDRGGAHSPAGPDSGSPAYDVALNGTYPEDFYSPKGLQYYGTGYDHMDVEMYEQLRRMAGRPNALVTVYRAVEKDGPKKIQPGDWVTPVRSYAKDHGEGAFNGDYKIIKESVHARDLWTAGDSMLEWGYHPQPFLPEVKLREDGNYPQGAAVEANPLAKLFQSVTDALGITQPQAAEQQPGAEQGGAPLDMSQFFNQPAYHGSPFRFDKFTLDHIGKGEGEQAYGWGLYFAGNREVAEFYKSTTAGDGFLIGNSGEVFNPLTLQHLNVKVRATRGDLDGAIAKAKEIVAEGGPVAGMAESDLAVLEGIKARGGLRENKGQLYTVDIPEDGEYLLWDKPLSEQPEKVRAALAQVAPATLKSEIKGMPAKEAEPIGMDIYSRLSRQTPGPKSQADEAASKYLNSLGIAGIKYLDGTSRDAGEGSFNYVIFDENAVKILDTMYQPRRAQPNRGEIAFGKDITQTPSVITLFQNADLSTFLHEMGHFQLEVLVNIASQPNAPVEIVADLDAAFKWFGVKGDENVQGDDTQAPSPDNLPKGRTPLEVWQAMSLEEKRPYHEMFARGFEAYLFEGKAPSQELTSLFARFRAWLVNVYKSIKALNVEISDDIRQVFDRLVATDEAIKQAEAVRSYAPLFASAEQVGDPALWSEMQQTAGAATQDAVDALQRRSMRDMQWLTNARGRLLKQMQRDAKAKRKAVEDEVRAEVRALPVYAATHFLKRGELASLTTEEAIKSEVHRLDRAALAEMYPESMLARPALERLQGVTRKDGLHPDLVAEMLTAAGYPFTSGDQLVREVINAPPEAERIEGLTDQRVLERYGDLANPDTIAHAVDEALHNDNRLRVLAAEVKALTKAPGPARAIAQAAKALAEATLARKALKAIKPRQHAAAETRAGKAAVQAFRKDDLATAAVEKRNQVLQGYLTKLSYEALTEVDKTRTFFNRVITGKDDQVVKTRDLDVVNAARAILANYGFGRRAKTAAEYLKAVQAYDPAMYDVLKDRVDAASTNGKPFDELTLEEMRGLRDEIESLWYLAKRSRQMEVDGDLLDRQDVQAALRERIEEIGIPDKVPGEGSAITPAEERLRKLQTAVAAARRVEAWAEAKDGGSTAGPFRKYLWQVVKDAADRYRTDKAAYLKALRDALAEIPNLKRGLIDAPELGYTFGKDEGGVGMSELMHALLHVGNESNKRKLLLGRNWATENADGTLNTARWDAFIDRMHREGVIAKAHYDARQKIWDALEALKPLAQKTHRDVFGKYFAEITAEQQGTPFGTYRGGYVPAIADTRIVNDADLRKLAETENENLAYAFPTTSKGFTKSRVEYNRPLLLDLRTLAQHIDKALLFAHLEQPVRDVRRVLMAKEVAYGLTRVDPAAYDGLLIPWLNRTAKQQVETPIAGDRGLMRFFSVMRQRAGVAAMFANVSNTAQQITGFSLAAVKVKPKYLLGAMADYVKAPRETARTVAEASPYMATRMENEVAQMIDGINDILLDPSTYEKAQTWTAKHAYFLQSAVDNVMSPVVWLGAYNQALEQGMNENDARRLADGTVRQTQGSTLPEDISRFETGNAFVRMFSQFAGYFNMQANLLGTAYAQTVEQMGVRKGAGRMLYITLLGFLAPAWAAEAITQAFRGGPDDEDDDGYLDDWLMAVFGFGALRNATAMIPVAGQGINAFVNAANSKPYDDRLGTAPAVSMIESAVRAPASVYKAVVDDASKQKAVRDVATLISLTTGLPATAVARPVGYGVGVAAGEIQPENEVDFARGLVSGAKGMQK